MFVCSIFFWFFYFYFSHKFVVVQLQNSSKPTCHPNRRRRRSQNRSRHRIPSPNKPCSSISTVYSFMPESRLRVGATKQAITGMQRRNQRANITQSPAHADVYIRREGVEGRKGGKLVPNALQRRKSRDAKKIL